MVADCVEDGFPKAMPVEPAELACAKVENSVVGAVSAFTLASPTGVPAFDKRYSRLMETGAVHDTCAHPSTATAGERLAFVWSWIVMPGCSVSFLIETVSLLNGMVSGVPASE